MRRISEHLKSDHHHKATKGLFWDKADSTTSESQLTIENSIKKSRESLNYEEIKIIFCETYWIAKNDIKFNVLEGEKSLHEVIDIAQGKIHQS